MKGKYAARAANRLATTGEPLKRERILEFPVSIRHFDVKEGLQR